MSNPFLTIAIPTYNRPESLEKLFDTFLKSLCDDERVEVLVCDNSDGGVAQQNETIFRGTSINYKKNDLNIGFFGNIITCVREAKGSYLWIISDDDFVSFSAFKKLIDALVLYHEHKINCVMLPFMNYNPFGGKSICNTISDWSMTSDCTMKGLIEKNNQLPFILFSSAIIRIEECTEKVLQKVEKEFVGNDFVQIPLFIETIGLNGKVVFYQDPVQEYKTSNAIRFNLDNMNISMTAIIKCYVQGHTLLLAYYRRNFGLWAGWYLWSRTGLVEVPNAKNYRGTLVKSLMTSFSIKNVILTVMMYFPKFVLRRAYIFYVCLAFAYQEKSFSMPKLINNILKLSHKGESNEGK